MSSDANVTIHIYIFIIIYSDVIPVSYYTY